MYANDNDPLPFLTLSAATRNVIEFLLQKEQGKDPEADRANDQREVTKPEENTEYVQRRLREFAAFERRARGGK